jgi:acyl-[acyl-carrier-protein]-phospholipid O-acyltransferase/long-chain-fatty-acid--[acyl-carrier-protein] ligase
MTPAEIVIMDKLPLLGSGKVDNLAVTRLVKERVAASQGAQPVVAASA